MLIKGCRSSRMVRDHAMLTKNMLLVHRSSVAPFKSRPHRGRTCIGQRCIRSAHSAARMATLQPQQLDAYFSRIQAPSEGIADAAADLSLLRRLISQHQRSIPFENLSLVRQIQRRAYSSLRNGKCNACGSMDLIKVAHCGASCRCTLWPSSRTADRSSLIYRMFLTSS